MSSEEEAREDVWRTLAEFTERERDDPEIAEIEASLDAYRTAIEQRVLAQQPCYREWEPRKGDRGLNCVEVRLACGEQQHTHATPILCPTCIARQAQETSG